MALMRSGKFKLIDEGKGLFQPIYLDDLVEGIAQAVEKGRVGESYILCGEEITTFNVYFRRLAAIAKVQKLPSVPYRLARHLFSISSLPRPSRKSSRSPGRMSASGTWTRTPNGD